MTTKRRRRRGVGSLSDLQRGLWSIFLYNLDLVEDTSRPHDLRLKASTAGVQAGLAWLKAAGIVEFEERLKQLESAAAQRNGHAQY